MTSFSGRTLYVVDGSAPSSTGPGYQSGLPLADNVRIIAHWMWGDLRAQWCESLALDLGLARPLTRYSPNSQVWVAAVLCAAAVDAGRHKRPGSWSWTLAGITSATQIPRDQVLVRYQELVDIGLSHPRVLPEYWRAHG